MGDVADILGLAGGSGVNPSSGRASPVLGGPLGPLQENKRGRSAVAQPKKGKPQGVSREVYALLGSEGLPPEVCVRIFCEHIFIVYSAWSIGCWCVVAQGNTSSWLNYFCY